jgi:hypothetical protein
MIARVLLLLSAALPALAQTAQISGRIVDSSHAVVPGVDVTVLGVDTGLRRQMASNQEGYYAVPLLPRGNYRISVRKSGFRPITHAGLSLDEGQSLRLDFTLQVGPVTESVSVFDSVPLVNTTGASVSTVIPSQRIRDLPMLGRNVVALAALAPGVRPLGDFGGLAVSAWDGSRASIAGGPPGANNFMVDGIADENFTSGTAMVILSPDATEEFRVITRNPSAEFGRTGGGVVNMISKSGTNYFHGGVYEFLQNAAINANGFFPNREGREKAPFVLNLYGGTLGGPVIRNRTFFFANWEQFQEHTQPRVFRTVPTLQQRLGDFSGTRTSSGEIVRIFDPLTTRVDAASGRRVREAFPGNLMPKSRINAVAVSAVAYYPNPNVAGVGATGANNFYGQGVSVRDKNALGLKLDHDLTPARRLSGRVTYDDTNVLVPNFYGNIAEIQNSDQTNLRRSATLALTDAIRSTVLFEARIGLNRYAPSRPARSYGFDVASLGLPASLRSRLQVPQFPLFQIADVTELGPAGSDHLIQANNSYSGTSALTVIRGKHAWKTGVEARVYQNNNSQGNNVLDFAFNRDYTRGPDPTLAGAAAGHGVASFLLGDPVSGVARRWAPGTYQARNLALFVQDDWKLMPRLTLNVGLRWEYEGAVTDRFNAIANFDPALEERAGDVTFRGGLVYPGSRGVPRGMRDNSLRDFDPRFGFAYQLSRKTSVRGGWGIYHLPMTGNFVLLGRTGFDMTTSMVASADGGFTPSRTLSDPFPDGVALPTGNSLGARSGLGSAITASQRSMRRGYSNQWNFNVQQELRGGWLLEVGYLGNRGVRLPSVRNYDYRSAAVRSMGNALLAPVANPFARAVASGTLSLPTVPRYVLLDTLPQFLGASGLDSWADSIYHALTVRAEKRLSRGLSVLASYTFSKLIDNNLGNGLNSDFTGGGSNSVQDWENLRGERAVSTSNLPQRFVLAASWALPLGRAGGRAWRRLAGGWQLNVIDTAQSGNPIAVTAPTPTLGGMRPDVAGEPTLAGPSIDRWFNTDAFRTIAPYTLGNGPRNLPRTRTDALLNLDFSVLKNIQVTDRVRAQIRGELFNLTNTPVFGQPGTMVTSGAFGVVSNQANQPRRVQVGVNVGF